MIIKILKISLFIIGLLLFILGLYGFKLKMILMPIITICFGLFYIYESIKQIRNE